MLVQEVLRSAFFVNETNDGALLLRPRTGGRAGVLVMNEATREHLEQLGTEDQIVTAVSCAISVARGSEHYLIAHEGSLVPSMVTEGVVRDGAENVSAPSHGVWTSYH